MGNAHSNSDNKSGQSIPVSTAPTVPLVPPPLPPIPVPNATKDSTSGASTSDAKLDIPGTMEDLHRKCKDLYPILFDGGKVMYNVGVNNHFQMSHTYNFSTVQPPGYRFGATYIGTQQISPSEAYPVLLADIDPSGNLNANIIHQLLPCLRAKMVAQISGNKWQATQVTADYRGALYTASLTMGNIDLINGSGVLVAHYLHQVHRQVALGTELAYQYGPQVPGGHVAVQSVAGRFSGYNYSVSGTVGMAGFHMCYYRKIAEDLQLGLELETSLRMQESVASVAYQFDIPQSNTTIKGTLDTNWTVGAVMEKKLMPIPVTFAVSGMLNHPKNQFKMGVGLIVG